jgi:transcriptional regulator with XRE-family HTH domain
MNPDNLSKQVGQAIARQRKLAKLTQSQVAERLEIEIETVSRFETGTRPASLFRLEQLSKLFCCPVVRFFQDDSEIEDDENTLFRSFTDIFQSLDSDERSFMIDFMYSIARFFKKRT